MFFIIACNTNSDNTNFVNSYSKVRLEGIPSDFKNIKKNILFIDKDSNLYIKQSILIMREDTPTLSKTCYFDDVYFNDSVRKLKNIVDIPSFRRIDSLIYIDKRIKYVFNDHPSTFPNIIAYSRKK